MSERGRDPIGYDAEVFERLLRDPMGATPLVEKPGIDPGEASEDTTDAKASPNVANIGRQVPGEAGLRAALDAALRSVYRQVQTGSESPDWRRGAVWAATHIEHRTDRPWFAAHPDAARKVAAALTPETGGFVIDGPADVE